MALAELVDGRIVVQTEWSEKDLIKQVPGSTWNNDTKLWELPLCWGSCVTLRGVFGQQVQIGPALNDWAWQERNKRIDPAMTLRNLYYLEHREQIGVITGKPYNLDNDHVDRLYPFQLIGREFLAIAGDALLGDEMGTGKTIQVLSALRRLVEVTGESPLPALVVCPNGVKEHWADRIREWLPEAEPYTVRGTAAQRKKILAAALKDQTAIVITSIESVRLLSRLTGYGSIALRSCRECSPRFGEEQLPASRCETHPKELNKFPFRTCILDEAHRVKDPKAKQTRAIWYAFQQSGVCRRWALTGTPIESHPGELWSIMRAIDKPEFPVKSKFVDRYAIRTWNAFGGMEIAGLRLDTRQELFQFLDPRFRRVVKALVLPQLPPVVRLVHQVEMTPKQRTAYVEVESGFVTRLDDRTLLISKSELAARTRLMQLASSYCTITRDPEDPSDPNKWNVEPREPCPKLDELLQILQDNGVASPGGPSVVISAEQRKLIELVSAGLERNKIDHVMLTGAVPEGLRIDNLRRFQAGQVPILLFTHQAGGVGIDMTKASMMIRLQRSWSLIVNRQVEHRVSRIGSEQHSSITLIDLVASGTIEVDQMRNLVAKMQRLDEISRDRQRLLDAGLDTRELDQEESILMQFDLGALTTPKMV